MSFANCAAPGRALALALLAALLIGCSTQDVATESIGTSIRAPLYHDYADFGSPLQVPDAASIYALDPDQVERFLDYFNAPTLDWIPPHRRLADYVESFGTGFNYQGETLAARDTMRTARGNCLSLAILTTSLAQLAEVEIGYQLVDSDPVFGLEGNIALRQRHVRSYLFDPDYEPESGALVMRRPGVIVDYFPSGRERFIANISASEYLAMYYRNRAASLIADGNYRPAFWHLRASFEHAPNHVDGINMMAVLHGRIGDDRRAEQLYRFALAHAGESVSLLRNYRRLLREQGRTEELEVIDMRLAQLDDPSPFPWLDMAREAYADGDFELAVQMYGRAIDRAGYLHEAHVGKAQAHYQLGERRAAEKAMQSALGYVDTEDARALYRAKLDVLRDGPASGCSALAAGMEIWSCER
jgi:Tfp pilus assembly protein PilF